MKEHQNMEWKESWRDEYLKWICAFANAEGGMLVIGKNDAGVTVGVPNARKLLKDLPNKIRDVLGLIVPVNLRREQGKEFIEIVVQAAPYPVSYKGEYYVRSGSTRQELKGASLDQFLLAKQGRHWDAVPVPNVSVSDLDTESIKRFRRLALRSGRLNDALIDEPDAALVEKLKLTEGTYLKRAAVLLFHADPTVFVTGAFVKIGFFRSQSHLIYHDEVEGDLFNQAHQTLDLLYTKYLKAVIHYEGIQRLERFPVPRPALREAVLNALVHRVYAVSAPVQIRIYDDRLTVWNPALLPQGWTVEKLRGEHASIPFNPDIANAFFRAGEIESWGRGIHQIFQSCIDAGSPEPRLHYEPNELLLEFPFAEDYLRGLNLEQTNEEDMKVSAKTSVETPETSEETPETSVKTSVESPETSVETPGTSVKTSDVLLKLLQQNPKMTLAEAATHIDRTVRSVERASAKLVKARKLRHVGPKKGGHWEVIQ